MEATGDADFSEVRVKRYRSVLRQIDVRLVKLFPEVNRINGAMGKLAGLSEDLRILSLNAELAAGRAGPRGVAVRALTQYTRGLVGRLRDLNQDTLDFNGLYRHCTVTLRAVRHLRQVETAAASIGTALQAGGARQVAAALDQARSDYLGEIAAHVGGITATTARLIKMVKVVDDVVAQAESIATNIAAEAVTAGIHREEFTSVAETMRRYVEELRRMSDRVDKALRQARRSSKGLVEALATIVDSDGRGGVATAAEAA